MITTLFADSRDVKVLRVQHQATVKQLQHTSRVWRFAVPTDFRRKRLLIVCSPTSRSTPRPNCRKRENTDKKICSNKMSSKDGRGRATVTQPCSSTKHQSLSCVRWFIFCIFLMFIFCFLLCRNRKETITDEATCLLSTSSCF